MPSWRRKAASRSASSSAGAATTGVLLFAGLCLTALAAVQAQTVSVAEASARRDVYLVAGPKGHYPQAPHGLAVATAGTVYVAEPSAKNSVLAIATDGTVSVLAGSGDGTKGFRGDGGPATNALLRGPTDVAVDSDGAVYIADTENDRIRKVSTDGTISTVAGDGNGCTTTTATANACGDGGPATSAQVSRPGAVAVTSDGTLYIAAAQRIRKVATDGTVSTVAGDGNVCTTTTAVTNPCGDGGPATSAQLHGPADVEVTSDGVIWIADSENHRIRKVSTDGTISTVAGDGNRCTTTTATANPCGDGGQATSAQLNVPQGLAVTSGGIVYIADLSNHRIRRVATDGTISTVAGTGRSGGTGDGGSATSARIDAPREVALDSSGNLYLSLGGSGSAFGGIRKVATGGIISTLSAAYGFGGDGGSATAARLRSPRGLAVGGAVYIADTYNHRIRKVATDGTISTAVGDGTACTTATAATNPCGDGGQATAAQLNFPFDVAVAGGAVYIADTYNHRIRKVATDGTVSTVAGDGNRCTTATASTSPCGDGGQATAANFNFPIGVAVAGDGAVYIADTYDQRIRKVATDGTISTVAGDGTVCTTTTASTSPCGDGGQATAAKLNYPYGVAVAGGGAVYIADTYNQRIRKVATDGTISTVAGDGNRCFSGATACGDGGQATSALLSYPESLAVASSGTVYIADNYLFRVRAVDAVTGTISNVAGIGVRGFSGNGGLATRARISRPRGVAIAANGDLYFSDSSHRVRVLRVRQDPVVPPGGGGGGPAPPPEPDPEPPPPPPVPPTAAFTLGAECADGLCTALTGVAVFFADTSSGTVSRRTWDFGDGTSSTSPFRSTTHSWSAPGFYTVTLTVSGAGAESSASRVVRVDASDPAGTCEADETTSCLGDSRFTVGVEWQHADGRRGTASVVRMGTNDSGLFSFFDRENWEILVKILDGCAVNGNIWVFGASSTDLGYRITVMDTATGRVREYRHEPGTPAPAMTDTAAFPSVC